LTDRRLYGTAGQSKTINHLESLNDVRFPHRHSLCRLICAIVRYSDGCVPLGVSFKPGSSVFATWDSEGHIRMYADDLSVFAKLLASSMHDRQQIQSLAWGCSSSDNIVFTTTASEKWNSSSGFHKAFDVENASLLYSIPNHSAGHCLDVDPRGTSPARCVVTSPTKRFT
jgi:hypothetical protein